MRVLTKEEVFKNKNHESLNSLWTFAKDNQNKLLNTEQRDAIINWIDSIVIKHHNQSGFFQNFKEMFSINGSSQVIEGQEDIAGLENNGMIFIVRQAEMGVAFGFKTENGIIEKSNLLTILDTISKLDVGFNNAKTFQSSILFDTIKENLKTNSNEQKPKLKL